MVQIITGKNGFTSYNFSMFSEAAAAYFLQQCLNALPAAALYGLLSFGYALTFGLSRRVDFTPGALFAFSGQVFVFFTAFAWERLWLVYPLALAIGAAAAFFYSGIAGGLIGGRIMGRLDRSSANARIIVSLAVMIILMELVRIAANARDVWLSPFLNDPVVFWRAERFTVVLTRLQVVNVLVMAAVVLTGSAVLARSALGRDWRACADDALAAALMGVDADRMRTGAYLATAALAALAGVLATAYFGAMDFGAGMIFGLKVVMIAAIGEQAAPSRSAAGAALFGVAETFWGAYLPFVWRDIAMFSLLVGLAVWLRRESRI
jgi:branched-chain amino acid transport system permease protein